MIKYDVEKLIEEVLTFDHIKIETRKFHYWKHWVNIKYVHIGKMLMPAKTSLNKTYCKYFIGYKDHKKVGPMWIMLLKINVYKSSLDET